MSLLLAIIMVVSVMAPVALATGGAPELPPGEPGQNGDGTGTEGTAPQETTSVTVHKILQTEANLNKLGTDGKPIFPGTTGIDDTKYVGKNIVDVNNGKTIESYFGVGSKDIGKVYFAWQNEAGNYIDSKGNPVYVKKTDKSIIPAGTTFDPNTMENIKYDHPKFETVVLGGSTVENTGIEFNTTELPAATYKIVEVYELSTYKNDSSTLTGSKAVPVVITLPLVNEDGVVTAAHVYPKNTEDKPRIDKNFLKDKSEEAIAKAIANGEITEADLGADYAKYQAAKKKISADIGKKIPYEVKTEIPKDSKYNTLRWTDTMTHGLTYNDDLVITGTYTDPVTLTVTDITFGATDYTIDSRPDGFTLTLTETGLDTVKEKAALSVVDIKLVYSATVNSTAVADTPDKNDIILEYGNKPSEKRESEPFTPSTTELSVSKTWPNAGAAPVDAVFDLMEKQADGSWKLVDTKTIKAGTTDSVSFTNLDINKEYKVVERPNGYNPTFTPVKDSTGKVVSFTVKNDKDDDNPDPLNPTEPEVVTYGKKFVKTNDKGKDDPDLERLAGAEFVVLNADKSKYLAIKDMTKQGSEQTAYEKAQADYLAAILELEGLLAKEKKGDPALTSAEAARKTTLQGDVDTPGSILQLEKDRNEKFKATKIKYEWIDPVATGTNPVPKEAYRLMSDELGRFEISGLAKGIYYLKEVKTPEGYAKLGKDIKFTVEEGSYESLGDTIPGGHIAYTPDDEASPNGLQIKNKKVIIPQTGGIGTIIFTVVGLAFMTVAIISLKKRRSEQ